MEQPNLISCLHKILLLIYGTQFQHKRGHIKMWNHPRSSQWHFDFAIVRKRDMQDICNLHSLQGKDGWNDHNLVTAKM